MKPSCIACFVKVKTPEMSACEAMIVAAVAIATTPYRKKDGARP